MLRVRERPKPNLAGRRTKVAEGWWAAALPLPLPIHSLSRLVALLRACVIAFAAAACVAAGAAAASVRVNFKAKQSFIKLAT